MDSLVRLSLQTVIWIRQQTLATRQDETKGVGHLPGKLPDDINEIRQLLAEGMTHQQIADRYGVSRQAVSYRVKAAGGGRPRVHHSHRDFFPWEIRSEHKSHPPHRKLYRRLIELHTLQEGWPQTDTARTMASEFEKVLAGANSTGKRLVVDYTPENGFVLIPAQPGDGPVFRARA